MFDQSATVEDRDELQASVAGFFARHAGRDKVRDLFETPTGYDRSVWSRLSQEVGLPALTISEQFGGAGFGPLEQAVVMEEVGRSLYCAPYLSSAVAATSFLQVSGDESVQAELLPRLASGELRGTVALVEDHWEQGLHRPRVTARASGGNWQLGGTKRYVLDVESADFALITAATPNGASVFVVDLDADDPAVIRESTPLVDMTRRAGELRLEGAKGRLVGHEGAAGDFVDRAVDLSLVAIAAEQVGAADADLRLTIDYLMVREQFGRVLASFQALKHRVADLLCEVETARALVGAAASAAAEGDWDTLSVLAGLAKVQSWDALDHVSSEAIQLHGGMGFTWEADPHLYFKRARGNEFLFGDGSAYRESAARALGLPA